MTARAGRGARGAARPARDGRISRGVAAAIGIAAAAIGAAVTLASAARPVEQGMPMERAADYVHAVIDADRTTYTKHVVNRLQLEDKVIGASEHFREEKTLPLPAQMLRMAAQLVAERGAFRYALISDAAINKSNLPKGEFEAEGIRAVRADPGKPWRRTVEAGGKRYLLSMYPDRAVVSACISCHNTHKQSPRRNWKLGDIMGAVVVSIPVE